VELRDYQGGALLHDGILAGLGTSAVIHTAVFFLVLFVSWLMPVKETPVPVCTVSLLAVEDVAGGSIEAEAGAMGRGNGRPAPLDGPEAVPVPPEPETEIIPVSEPEKPDVVHIPDKKEVPPPVPKKVEKPKVKPRKKPKPASVQSRPQDRVAAVEAPPPASDVAKSPEGVPGGLGAGVGGPDARGGGKAGAGASGEGHGPQGVSFGSGDGPRFLSRVRPEYPKYAREAKKEGTVLLCLTINERGKLMSVEVVKPAGSGFDEEAVRCVKASRFSPAKKNGKPVMCRAYLPFRFVLKK
jgi:TonB family protein